MGSPKINGLVRRGNRFGGGKSGGVLTATRSIVIWRLARRNESARVKEWATRYRTSACVPIFD